MKYYVASFERPTTGHRRIITLLSLAASAVLVFSEQGRAADGPRRFVLLDARALEDATSRLREGSHPRLNAALNRLVEQAEGALEQQPISVVDKPMIPPSGDKRDYMSLAIYWWPRSTNDGLPYIHRDGRRNPEYREYDLPRITAMSRAVETLALAYGFTRDERLARHAALLLRTWFLDERTAMRPHMRYAQRIPGLFEGTRQGIIETVCIARSVIDSVALLTPSAAWTDDDAQRLEEWFTAYLDWLRDSPLGKAEAKRANNHGTWYDVQTAALAIACGRSSEARDILAERSKERIDSQITADGRQPEELSRTKSLSYSLYNLDAMFTLATIGQQVGVDLWNFRGHREQGIPTALDYVLAYARQPDDWPHEQIYPVDLAKQLRPLVEAAVVQFGDQRYRGWLKELPPSDVAGRWRLQLASRPRATD